MAHTLLVRLASRADASGEWLTVDSSGHPTGAPQRGPLALAAAAASGASVLLLVPATQVLLAAPLLPPGSGAKLARVIPFALEEQLTEDVDHLHFAIGRRGADGSTTVAVVARDTLRAWLAECEAAGLAPRAVYPDIAGMPENPGQTVLWLEGDRLALRRPNGLPFLVEATPLEAALEIAGLIADQADGDAEPRPLESAILHLTGEDWERVRDEVEAVLPRFETLRVQLLPDGALPWLARGIIAGGTVNLLQGDFARSPAYVDRWREWRVAAFLGIALLGVHVGAESLRIHLANRESARSDGEIARLYAATMPAEPMHDARRQMEARLRLVRDSAAGPSAFLRTMQALATAVGQTPETRIEAFAFSQGTLDLTLSAKNVDGLARLSRSFKQQGFRADIRSSTPDKAGLEAQLRVRGSGAGQP